MYSWTELYNMAIDQGETKYQAMIFADTYWDIINE